MPLIHIDIPKHLIEELDRVALDKRLTEAHVVKTIPPAQLQEAKDIAHKQGIAAANAFLRSAQGKAVRHSRTSVALEMLLRGMDAYTPSVTPVLTTKPRKWSERNPK